MPELQQNDAWFADRLGKASASRIADIVARTKSGYSASRENYKSQLIVERLTGQKTESYTNAAMQWGIEQEDKARELYEFMNDETVEQVGFIDHPTIAMTGASPDGLVGDDGLIEIKCPNTATHINTLLTKKIDNKYYLQMMWQMVCTGRNYCNFVSFDPRLPSHLQMFIKRVDRDDGLVAELESEVTKFLNEINETIDTLENL